MLSGYDDLYRKISESVNYGAFAKTNAYTYLKNGLKETYTGSDDITYGYLYDSNNQLTGVQVPNLGFITINEYSWNRPASMTLPGGTTKNFSYDPLMRIKQIETKDPGQNVLLNYQYNYDKMDNITSKDTEHGAYGYDYDDLYRLKTVDNPVQDDEAFTYDLVGNRLTAVDTDGDWTYNGNNELVTSAPSSAGTTGETTFDYDANGNMIQKTVDGVVTSYVYNIEDRLTQIWNGEVDTGSLTAEYYYDPFGRRLWKEVSGVRTYFHYADEGLVAEIDAVGTETKTYGYKPGSTWTTDPLFMKVGTEYYFYHNDHLGTPQKITAVNGTIVWDAKYSSFGEATVEVATVENNLRFPGQYYDGESVLHYNYHRFYNANMGRYLRTDPICYKGGVNLFLYSAANPVRRIDPWGLFHYYKRWGGPDYTAGQKGQSWDTLTEPVRRDIQRQIQNGWNPNSPYQPLDAQDTCYMHHDICYGEARMDCRSKNVCFTDCTRPKLNKCDADLVNCLSQIGKSGKALDEARRIAAKPAFKIQPASRKIYHEATKDGRTPPTEGYNLINSNRTLHAE